MDAYFTIKSNFLINKNCVYKTDFMYIRLKNKSMQLRYVSQYVYNINIGGNIKIWKYTFCIKKSGHKLSVIEKWWKLLYFNF